MTVTDGGGLAATDNQRGDAIEAEIRRSAPTATQEQIREQVRGRLKEEFGLQ